MVTKNVGEMLKDHVNLEVECIDRMYLNGYVPRVQSPGGFAYFVKTDLGLPVISTTAVASMSKGFVKGIEQYAKDGNIELIKFKRGIRKDDLAQEKLAAFKSREGVLFIGKAQEKASVFRTEVRRGQNGERYPWVVRGTAMPNHYYFYLLDEDFGPMFIKFCSYFPYAVKVCLNGHEWLQRQLSKEGIDYQRLDNGILSCGNVPRMQELCNQLGEEQIAAVFRKWLNRLPNPYSPVMQEEGCQYELSIVQAEFALTHVFDRPSSGRQFFEEIMRDHLDLGRPENIQLIFDRRITKRTDSQFKTRVITQGVLPSLNVYYKWSRIKQYYKEGRALRTETVINNTRDFDVNRGLCNLGKLRQIGFAANRRLLRVQNLSHNCMVGEAVFSSVASSVEVDNQRASGLRFGDPRAMALMNALCLFLTLPHGFRNRHLRACIAHLLEKDLAEYKPGSMTYDLRRLRLHGLIEKVPGTLRYFVTEQGVKVAAFYTRVYARVFRPGLSVQVKKLQHLRIVPTNQPKGLRDVEAAIGSLLSEARMAS